MPACPTKDEIDPRFTIEQPAKRKDGAKEGGRERGDKNLIVSATVSHSFRPLPYLQASLALPLVLVAFITRMACFDARPYPLILLPITTSQSVSVASSALKGEGRKEGREGG